MTDEVVLLTAAPGPKAADPMPWDLAAPLWDRIPPSEMVMFVRLDTLHERQTTADLRVTKLAGEIAAVRGVVRWVTIVGAAWLGLLTACLLGVATR